MNREEEYNFLNKNRKTYLSSIIDEDIFSSVLHGRSFDCFNENYWCMIEQLYMEGKNEIRKTDWRKD